MSAATDHPRRRQARNGTGREKPVPAGGGSRWVSASVCALLIVLCLAVYAQTVKFELLLFDDNDYVTDNPHVRSGLNLKGLAWAFTTMHASNWHPLTWISHMLDCRLYGMRAGGHHLTSVLLHAGNSLLLFLVLGRMTGRLGRSAFVAAVFAVHPLHVESVAWVAERKDVLSTLFGLLAVWAYARYAEKSNATRLLLALSAFALSLLAKPMLVTLPLVFLLLDFWPLARGGWDWRLLREKTPFFVLALASTCVTYAAQQKGGAVSPLEALPLGVRLQNAVVTYAVYLIQVFWPKDLAFFYPHPGHGQPPAQVFGALLLLVSTTLLVLKALRGHPYMAVGWLWYLGTLVPVIGLVQVGGQARADRYMYFPMVGILVMVAWGVAELRFRHRRIVLAALAALSVAGLTVLAWCQTRYWQNNRALFEHALAVTVNNPVAHLFLGITLMNEGRPEEAVAQIQKSLSIRPGYVFAHVNLGVVLERSGATDQAIVHFREALRLKPECKDCEYNLGVTLAKQNQLDEALEHYSRARRLNPESALVENNLATVLARLGRTDESIAHLERALRIDPAYGEAHYNLGVTMAQVGRADAAAVEYRQALRLKPDYPDARYKLALLLAERREFGEAMTHYREFLRANPGNAIVHNSLGAALAGSGRLDDAIASYAEALRLQPG